MEPVQDPARPAAPEFAHELVTRLWPHAAGFRRPHAWVKEDWSGVPGVLAPSDGDTNDAADPDLMAALNGTPLNELMRCVGALDVARALHLAIEMGQILEIAHSLGLIHGDLRPDNVLIVGDGDDEGLRILAPRLPPSTGAAVPPGSGGPPAGVPATADIIAFGEILYRLLAGVGPYDVGSRAAHRDVPAPLGKRRREVAPALERLVMQMLAPAPERRPREISEVVNRLWIEHERLRGHRHRGAAGHAGPWSPPTRRLVGVAAALLVLVGGGLIASWPTGTPREARVAPAPADEVPARPRVATGPDSTPGVPVPAVEAPGRMTAEIQPAPARGRRSAEATAQSRSIAAVVPAAADARSASAPGRPETTTAGAAIEPGPALPAPPVPDSSASGPVASDPRPDAPAGAVSPSPAPTPMFSERQAPILSPTSRDADPQEGVRQALAPPPASVETLPAPIPAIEADPPDPNSTRPSVRGSPPPGSEAGPSAIASGYGARGVGGMFEGRLRLSSRDAVASLVSNPAGRARFDGASGGHGSR